MIAHSYTMEAERLVLRRYAPEWPQEHGAVPAPPGPSAASVDDCFFL
jgi:hypothetical protein